MKLIAYLLNVCFSIIKIAAFVGLLASMASSCKKERLQQTCYMVFDKGRMNGAYYLFPLIGDSVHTIRVDSTTYANFNIPDCLPARYIP